MSVTNLVWLVYKMSRAFLLFKVNCHFEWKFSPTLVIFMTISQSRASMIKNKNKELFFPKHGLIVVVIPALPHTLS